MKIKEQRWMHFLYSAKNVACFPFKDKWIFFLPDSFGMPILTSALAKHIFDAFIGGAFIHHVIEYISELMGASDTEVLQCIDYFYKNKYIRQAPDRQRYAAQDNTPVGEDESIEVWLHITNHCNLGCEYCFVSKSNAFMPELVMQNTIHNLISTVEQRKIKQLTIKFAGGEPMVAYKKIIYFYNTLKEKMADTKTTLHGAILTNGTAFNDEMIAYIKANHFGISISLDGYGEEGHDIYRVFKNSRKGSWNLILNNIEKLISVGIKPYILATLSEDSIKTLPSLMKWVVEKNLRVRLGVVREPKLLRSDQFGSSSILYQNYCKVLNDSFEKMFIELEKIEYTIDIIRKISICELNFEKPRRSTCCGIGRNHIVIREDGLLSNCPMTQKEMAIPQEIDILSATQKTFLYSPLEREKRKEKSCLDCQWFPVCVGGCPVNNKRNSGNPFSISPLHDFYQYVIPRFIKFYGKKISQYASANNLSGYHFLEY